MLTPKVTFVVPCYKLGHLLQDCVRSILRQTYPEFEVLIMDDCSPDDTPRVAKSFQDDRVIHVRNRVNLGHLRNYNYGISLARGTYIWLISADDRLHSSSVLSRYVDLMERNPSIGYAFCPAMRLQGGEVKELLDYSVFHSADRIITGRVFLEHLIYANTIVAPSVLARKECYELVSMFPLDMPWGGDWYLWCVFALHYDVAYFAEPMVCYRRHAGSMTSQLMDGHVASCSLEDIELPWNIRRQAKRLGLTRLVRCCDLAIAKEYAKTLVTSRYSGQMVEFSEQDFLRSLASHTGSPRLRRWIRGRTYATMGDLAYWNGDSVTARRSYGKALRTCGFLPRVWLQFALLRSGTLGCRLRSSLGGVQRRFRRVGVA
ncbi:MAG: glycosyltransferase family 2 protein [Acidobacteria bacterium]|nr:glycosyltransferase family 2 protein [Acidobacteriota bacterium]